MAKLKLGIDIDEVLRSKWAAFDRFYADEFGEDGIKEPFDTYDYRNHYEFNEKEETTMVLNDSFLTDEKYSKMSPKEYIVDESTGKAPVDEVAFSEEKKTLTPEEVYNQFLYKDYLLEIHGQAPKLYMNADVDIVRFVKQYSEYFDFVFFAKQKPVAIPATLFFLSKMRIATKNIAFVETNEELWSQVDWVVSVDPTIIASKPEGKVAITFTRLYNQGVEADYTSFGVMRLISTEEDEGNNEVEDFTEFIKNKITK